jgi:hypothetical protein
MRKVDQPRCVRLVRPRAGATGSQSLPQQRREVFNLRSPGCCAEAAGRCVDPPCVGSPTRRRCSLSRRCAWACPAAADTAPAQRQWRQYGGVYPRSANQARAGGTGGAHGCPGRGRGGYPRRQGTADRLPPCGQMHDALETGRAPRRTRRDAVGERLAEDPPGAGDGGTPEPADLDTQMQARPCDGRSARSRSYRLWTCDDRRPHSGQAASGAVRRAMISRRSGSAVTLNHKTVRRDRLK